MSELQGLVEKALEDFKHFFASTSNPVMAYSGGKDAIVTLHLAHQVQPVQSVCEISFFLERQLANIQEISTQLGFSVDYVAYRDWDWLKAHPEYVFANASKLRGKSFAQRQQRTAKLYAQKRNADAVIFGRRLEENTVPKMRYQKQGVEQFHPLMHWREKHIWEYFEAYKIPIPWVYTTLFGQKEGNAPFYALKASDVGGYENAWQLITSLDPSITKGRLGL